MNQIEIVKNEEITNGIQYGPLCIPDSPAPNGYLANPYRETVEEAHRLLAIYLSPNAASTFEVSSIEEGVEIAVRPRQAPEDISKIPTFRGRAFIVNVRPIEILACIHLLSYRLIWDTRMSSGRILQRYGHYDFLFYVVYRGIAQIYLPRDAAGIQDIRCWNKEGKMTKDAFPETNKIDVVYRSVEAPEVPFQEGKVRMQINLGAYRIEWMDALQGCNVTWVGDADIATTVPTSIWKVFSKEFPKNVIRLRDAMEQFGVPPFVLDVEDCVVIQTTFFYSQDRKTTMRHHVRKAGSYVIVFDQRKMFPFGIDTPMIEGEGANAVQYQQDEDRLRISVGKDGIGKEYVIIITPKDAESQPKSLSEWW